MPEKTVVSWNAIFSGYAQYGFAKEAIELFNDMMNASVQPDMMRLLRLLSYRVVRLVVILALQNHF